MKKNVFVRSLFGTPVPYESKPARRTELISFTSDGNGRSVVEFVCVEDKMKDVIPLDFNEVTLDSLVSKGVNSHGLDMIDSSKLGVDAGVDALAEHIRSNVSDYVESVKSE